MTLKVGLFDTDGTQTLRDRVAARAKIIYAWPFDRAIRPLEPQDTQAIFVVGCGHSGTSLLATVLGRSRELLLVGYESGAFFPMRGLASSKEVTKSWQNISLQLGYRGFVEKTPKHVHCLSRIRRVVPQARFIAIVRDGRDVMASFLSRGFTPEFAVQRWIDDNAAILAASSLQNLIMTSYEALVTEPEAEVKRICEALGLTFAPDMLSGSDSGYGWIQGQTMGQRAEQTAKPIYDSRGKWKDKLSPSELDLFWSRAEPMMAKLGYDDGLR